MTDITPHTKRRYNFVATFSYSIDFSNVGSILDRSEIKIVHSLSLVQLIPMTVSFWMECPQAEILSIWVEISNQDEIKV